MNPQHIKLNFSIPKRVSEVLWPHSYITHSPLYSFSIPKRVSEVLWLA